MPEENIRMRMTHIRGGVKKNQTEKRTSDMEETVMCFNMFNWSPRNRKDNGIKKVISGKFSTMLKNIKPKCYERQAKKLKFHVNCYFKSEENQK